LKQTITRMRLLALVLNEGERHPREVVLDVGASDVMSETIQAVLLNALPEVHKEDDICPWCYC
jgi:hypothetical protein